MKNFFCAFSFLTYFWLEIDASFLLSFVSLFFFGITLIRRYAYDLSLVFKGVCCWNFFDETFPLRSPWLLLNYTGEEFSGFFWEADIDNSWDLIDFSRFCFWLFTILSMSSAAWQRNMIERGWETGLGFEEYSIWSTEILWNKIMEMFADVDESVKIESNVKNPLWWKQ